MTVLLKLVGGAILLACLALGGFVADLTWNDSRLFYAAVGRDRLVADCTPLTKEDLIGKGFSPTDLVFEPRPSVNMAFGSSGGIKILASGFTFTDGPNGPRVDGQLSCTVIGHSIKVEVEVDSLPRRVT